MRSECGQPAAPFTRNAVDSTGERAPGGRICRAFRHVMPIAGRGRSRRCRCAGGKCSRRAGCGYPGLETTRHAVHFTGECDVVRPDARGRVWTTGLPTTKKAVPSNGERRRPIAREACRVWTSGRREIRNAAHSNGARGSAIAPHAYRGVDILPHDPLEALCISMVSVAPGRTGCRLARPFVIVDRGFEGRAFYPHSRSRVSFEYVPRCGYPVAESSRRAVYFSGERGRVRLGHVGASPDRRASAGLRAPLFTPESATACDTVPTLTVEFHSVSSGRGSGYPHPGRRPCSIAILLLTIGIHSVSSRRGSRCSRRDRRALSIECRRSPSEFTAFRFVASWAVHT